MLRSTATLVYILT